MKLVEYKDYIIIKNGDKEIKIERRYYVTFNDKFHSIITYYFNEYIVFKTILNDLFVVKVNKPFELIINDNVDVTDNPEKNNI